MTTYLTAVDDLVKWAYRQPKNKVFRRLDIYESDGETLWYPAIDTDRLISGSINLSYGRDERRQLSSLVIANYDGILNYDRNGFWYDKILKIYRGIRFYSAGELYQFEYQIGEFMIDKIDSPEFPHVITINGRDYTKKLKNDSFPEATTFTAGKYLDDVVKAIAFNGGIRKFRLNSGGVTLGADLTLDRNSARWDGITKACTPYGIDCYFSNDGYLVTEPSADVSSTPPFIIFGADESQDGATRAKRSISDANIFNDLVVRSSNKNAETAGVAPSSRWQNTSDTSSTSIQRIGRRSKTYESELFLTKADTDAYLESWKQIAALETWELSFSFRFLPWIEVGRVIELPDSDNNNVPSRYLLTDVDATIGLGAINGTGKRLTIVE